MPHRHDAVAARAILLCLGLLAAGAPARAQVQIQMGQSLSGQLTASDPTLADGSRYDAYVFFAQAGQSVQITVTSSDFDAFVMLFDQNNNELGRDDDGGGGLNARLSRVVSATGSYRIIVNSYRSGAFGNYTVSLTGSGGTPVVAAAGGMLGMIGANQQVSGNLTSMDARYDGKPHQAWGFQCAAGQMFQMDILSSWDNYALVFDPAGNVVARDDDTGDGLNAQIRFTCPMMGVYRLAVTTYTASTTPGPYTLQVQSAAMAMPQPMPITPQPMPVTPQPMPITPQPMPVTPQPMPVTPQPMVSAVPAPGAIGQMAVGQTVTGRLETGDQMMSDSTWADVWQFQGIGGQTVTVELRSAEFDTYVQLLDAGGNRLAEDDDSLGDLDSRVVARLSATGMFQIVVNNFGDRRRSGTYTLTLR